MYIVYFRIWKDLVLLKKMLFKDTLFHNLKWQDGWKIKVVWIVQLMILVVFKPVVPYRTGHIHPTHLYQYSCTVLNVSS